MVAGGCGAGGLEAAKNFACSMAMKAAAEYMEAVGAVAAVARVVVSGSGGKAASAAAEGAEGIGACGDGGPWGGPGDRAGEGGMLMGWSYGGGELVGGAGQGRRWVRGSDGGRVPKLPITLGQRAMSLPTRAFRSPKTMMQWLEGMSRKALRRLA